MKKQWNASGSIGDGLASARELVRQLDVSWTRAGLELDMNFRHEISTQERNCEWFQMPTCPSQYLALQKRIIRTPILGWTDLFTL